MGKRLLTEGQLDFLNEMLSIGAGNAATALSQLFNKPVELRITDVKFLENVSSVSLPAMPMASVKMGVIGDIRGYCWFVIQLSQKDFLIGLTENASYDLREIRQKSDTEEWRTSILEEMGNIFAGTYLGAINRFCRLNMPHTMPVLEKDISGRLQSTTIESLVKAHANFEIESVVLAQSDLVVMETTLKTYFMFFIASGFTKELTNAIDCAKRIMET